MNGYVGMRVLLRSAVTTLVVMLLLALVLATRLMLNGVPLSPTLLALLCVLQLPVVVVFSCGLGTYWLVDEWVRSGAWSLFNVAGVSRRKFVAAVVAPGVVVALWMVLFNVTAFRKASADAMRVLAHVQLDDAARAMARAGVLQVGEFRLLARAVEGAQLQHALLSFDTLAVEAEEASFEGDTLRAQGVTLLLLERPLRFTAEGARLTLPGATHWAWGGRLQSDKFGMTKGLALGLSVPAAMLSALLCASLSRRLGRLRAFVLWAVLGAGGLLGVNAALAAGEWWAFQPLWPVAALLSWGLGFWRVREA